MTVELYLCSDDNNKLDKNLQSVNTFDGALRKETSILTPSITINTDYVNANYAYIPDWGRFYFIENITSVRDGLLEFTMRVDPLMTYKNDILNLSCVIERQQNKWNVYIDDSEFMVENKTRIQTFEFPNGFSDIFTNILCVSGGD